MNTSKDKFALFKTGRFRIALKHGVHIENTIYRSRDFKWFALCGCLYEFKKGWYEETWDLPRLLEEVK